MKLSIVIPTYECEGKGWLYLSELLNSIYKQSFKDFEVVISDQSKNNDIKDLATYYKKFLNISLIDASGVKRTISANTNNAIKNCTGEYIKIMYMDDFFIDNNALEKIIKASEESPNKWIVNGTLHCESIHFPHSRLIPQYNDNIHLGQNSISCPTVLTLKQKEYFDEELNMLMDCEFYKRMYIKYGDPLIITDPLTCNRNHEDQTQKKVGHIPATELNYCIEKFKLS